jgi:hypothetical protein
MYFIVVNMGKAAPFSVMDSRILAKYASVQKRWMKKSSILSSFRPLWYFSSPPYHSTRFITVGHAALMYRGTG